MTGRGGRNCMKLDDVLPARLALMPSCPPATDAAAAATVARPGYLAVPLARVLSRFVAIAFAGALAACAPAGPEHDLPQRLTPSGTALPPMRLFSDAHPAAPERSNAEIAEDILELGFFMESGRPIARFSRFDGPVALRLVGAPQVARIEAERLVARFRREAGIPISLAPDAAGGIITVQFVTQRRMQAVVPEAA